MKWLCTLTVFVAVSDVSQAGFRSRRQQPQTTSHQSYQSSHQSGYSSGPGYQSSYQSSQSSYESSSVSTDPLSEVNELRARRGLRPFIRDEALTQAASRCAGVRAMHRLFGHTNNDFSFLPPGAHAASAGCAAYPASYGWMSCCTYDNYTYAGAAYAVGADGKRYMQLFVR